MKAVKSRLSRNILDEKTEEDRGKGRCKFKLNKVFLKINFKTYVNSCKFNSNCN